MKGVVVVESPAKAKTLSTFLGKDYKVIASYGHVRDLVSKRGSVDPNNHFKMLWEESARGKKQIKEIAESIKKYDNLYLATDPDREGEAISWHILEILNDKKLLKNKQIQRVVFHEITKSAVSEAFANPRELDQNLVNAYLARRVLDYLVGFSLSPILWRKMPGAKSAGRVQSVALRLIVERELEIEAFKPEEYWTLHNLFNTDKGDFLSTLISINGKKLEKLDIKTEVEAENIRSDVETKKYTVDSVEKKSVKRNPYAPFTTSTLQQDASRKLGFPAKKTMQIAQKLYEGISIEGTMTGLITYMRTDSTNLSNEALDASRKYISETFDKKYLPKNPKIYKTKTKNAQEAHEAIRPTSCSRIPESLKDALNEDELKLYELIWKRTIASQMESAVLDQVTINIQSTDKKYKFKVTGSSISFDGFLKVYGDDDKEQELRLPNIDEKTILTLKDATKNQHFTQPPAKFNEASLVKKLEELGIGRPSTYATIINVIQERKYAVIQKRAFVPENIGVLVVSFLKNFFTKYVEYSFTANLEEELDDISNGKIDWETVLNNFWKEFYTSINSAQELTVTKVIDTLENNLHDYIFKNFSGENLCPVCNKGKMHLKLSRMGAFLGCSNYPECKAMKSIEGTDAPAIGIENTAQNILGQDPNNGNDNVMLKKGPYGYYFEWENTKDPTKKKPKRLAVPKFITNVEDLNINDALTLTNLPKNLGKHPKLGKDIILCLGRFGPYVSVGGKTLKLEKSLDFLRFGLDEIYQKFKNELS